ncbi:hypothetical protein [Caulobacter endophyticus]|uniref:hypothetical protein n=1 Tax=Caulobacter endophyticus TaxID=2172652 RepID=UPI00240FED96|nr:hypothetical protein [Caulobacter endophyticus]MDG2530483.1 hypothetical protein [Caulobacter endophyticus]
MTRRDPRVVRRLSSLRRRRLAFAVRETLARVARLLLIALGVLILLAGAVLTPLPGHVGLPLLVIGLMVVLRNSFQAKRRFIRWQRRHPKLIFPIRRLMRREPEILLVAWQQLLRSEKLLLRRPAWRVLKRGRKALRQWIRRRAS